MNNDQDYENKMREARVFAKCFIQEANTFQDFSVNMLDYLGPEYCQEVKEIYKELSQFLFEQGVHQDSHIYVNEVSEDEMLGWLESFQRQQAELEQGRQEDFEENIDELQFLVKNYRSSEEFQKMMDFVGKFHYMAPYNAMLVELQKPGACLWLKAKDWEKENRMIKPNAQNLITLRQFGPVQCMYDLSDTEPMPDCPVTEENEILERWKKWLMSAQGEVSPLLLQRLIDNLPSYGIYLDESFSAANTYGGYIKSYNHQIKAPLGISHNMTTTSRFLVSINRAQSNTDKFHTICHELGHLFCRHLFYDREKVRHLSIKEREFEAESVAWIVCKRHGINNPSEQYLAGYASKGEIPICSTDYMLKAVTEIDKMLSKPVYASQSMWYKEDKAFKSELDKYKKDMQEKGKKKTNFSKYIFNVMFSKLPYEEQPNQIIYVESSYDDDVNAYIKKNYYSIQNYFHDSGLELIYIPKLLEEIKDDAIVGYNTPYAEGFKDISISSDFLLKYLTYPHNRKDFPASLVFPVLSPSGHIVGYRAIALDKSSGYKDTCNLSNILVDINRYSGIKSRNKVSDRCQNDRFSESLYPQQLDEDSHHLTIDVLEMLDEAKIIIKKLKKGGIPQYILEQLVRGDEKLSHLHITKDNRIILPDYNNCEVTMGPLPKTVFFFYLRHQEGVCFKDLSDHKEELTNIYRIVKGGSYSTSEAKISIDNLTNPTNNSINENCSRIRKAFISKFNERLAQNYFVVGDRTEPKRITLPRDLVEWDE